MAETEEIACERWTPVNGISACSIWCVVDFDTRIERSIEEFASKKRFTRRREPYGEGRHAKSDGDEPDTLGHGLARVVQVKQSQLTRNAARRSGCNALLVGLIE